MPNILFVCTANQFRSPLCAAFFEQALRDKEMDGQWTVKSAGTWVPRRSGAHPAAIREGRKLGVDLSQHRSSEIDEAMIQAADLVVVMTKNHEEALQIEFSDFDSKIHCLTEFSGSLVSDIEDPAEEGFINAETMTGELLKEIETAFLSICKFVDKQAINK